MAFGDFRERFGGIWGPFEARTNISLQNNRYYLGNLHGNRHNHNGKNS
jgi:hypothetical protein